MEEDNKTPIVKTCYSNDSPTVNQVIKVIGVGGCGCNTVEYMYHQNINNVTYVLLNTDYQKLDGINVPVKIGIGNGLSTGNNPEIGKQEAEVSADKIAELFNDSTNIVLIICGMGGGTGSGAAPVVARIARERGLLTIGIVTIPFLFEGKRKIIKAFTGIEEMSKYVDALLVINNQLLSDIYHYDPLVDMFNQPNKFLAKATQSISELIVSQGKINFEKNELVSLLNTIVQGHPEYRIHSTDVPRGGMSSNNNDNPESESRKNENNDKDLDPSSEKSSNWWHRIGKKLLNILR